MCTAVDNRNYCFDLSHHHFYARSEERGDYKLCEHSCDPVIDELPLRVQDVHLAYYVFVKWYNKKRYESHMDHRIVKLSSGSSLEYYCYDCREKLSVSYPYRNDIWHVFGPFKFTQYVGFHDAHKIINRSPGYEFIDFRKFPVSDPKDNRVFYENLDKTLKAIAGRSNETSEPSEYTDIIYDEIYGYFWDDCMQYLIMLGALEDLGSDPAQRPIFGCLPYNDWDDDSDYRHNLGFDSDSDDDEDLDDFRDFESDDEVERGPNGGFLISF